MKLNYDCVRDVLLAVEKTETIAEDLSLTPLEVVGLFDRLPEYKDNEILYTVEKLKEAIKSIGTFQVPVKLHPKVTAQLKVVVKEK